MCCSGDEVMRMRDSLWRRIRADAGPLALVIALALLAGACGRGAGTAPGGTAGVPAPTASGTGGTPGSGQRPGVRGKGAVTVSLVGGPYAAGQAIPIAIHNGLGAPIYAINTHTSCTPIQLQRWDGIGWQSVGGCGGQVPHPSVLTIARDVTVTLQPAQGADQGGVEPVGISSSGTWPAGTYRAELAYTMSASQPFAAGTSAVSVSFTIG
jgi:hypothetical protein